MKHTSLSKGSAHPARGLLQAPGAPRWRRHTRMSAKNTAAGGKEASSPMVQQSLPTQKAKLNSQDNYANLCSNMGEVIHRPVSGYAGRWSRYQGGSVDKLLADGDIIYGFKALKGSVQVWKAEEGDLDSPKLQSQRNTLPALQQDPLQLQLKMDTFVIEVSPDAPLVDPSFASIPASKLSATMKTLAVPDTGNLVVTGALPVISGTLDANAAEQQANTTGHPDPKKSWFNRLYLRVPGNEPSSSSRWSVMLHYGTSTGDLLTHYHTWEAAIRPEPASLTDVFTPGAHKELLQQEQDCQSNIRPVDKLSKVLDELRQTAQYRYSLLSYSADGADCSYSSSCSIPPAAPAKAESTTGNSTSDNGTDGSDDGVAKVLLAGPNPVEVWYSSRCYCKAPASLNPEVLAGQDAILEVGALLPAGSGSSSNANGGDGAAAGLTGGRVGGLVRWLVCYSSTGDRRLKWARNEVFTVQGQHAVLP